MDNKTIKTLAVVAIVVAVGGLTMGYAALTQTLNIKTTATVQSGSTTWNISFTNPGTGTATGHAVKGTMNLTGTDVNVTGVVLKTAGDTVTYTFDVKNAGQVNAKLTTLTPKTPTVSGGTLAEGAYTYTLTYQGGNAVKVNDTLSAGETKNMVLTIKLANNATLPTADAVISGLGYTLVYTQA